jgi:hypothetical protein
MKFYRTMKATNTINHDRAFNDSLLFILGQRPSYERKLFTYPHWSSPPRSIIKHPLPVILPYFFWDSSIPRFLESVLCGFRWRSKIPAILGSYKRYTSWLELETCCTDFKPFTITLRPLGTDSALLFTIKHDCKKKSRTMKGKLSMLKK